MLRFAVNNHPVIPQAENKSDCDECAFHMKPFIPLRPQKKAVEIYPPESLIHLYM